MGRSSSMDRFDAHVCVGMTTTTSLEVYYVLDGSSLFGRITCHLLISVKLSKKAILLPFLCPHFNVRGGNLRAIWSLSWHHCDTSIMPQVLIVKGPERCNLTRAMAWQNRYRHIDTSCMVSRKQFMMFEASRSKVEYIYIY